MRKIVEIAGLYLMECRRKQIFLLPVFAALLLLAVPSGITAFNLSAFERVSRDAVLTIINGLTIVMAMALGSSALQADIERRTLYVLLTRPMKRFEYIAGKYLGLLFLLAGTLSLTGLCAFMSVSFTLNQPQFGIFVGVGFDFLEGAVLGAMCLCFATFCTPAAALSLSLLVFIVGGISNAYISFFLANNAGYSIQHFMVVALKALAPHFEVFAVKNAVVHGDSVSLPYALAALIYAVVWSGTGLFVADWCFARRDL